VIVQLTPYETYWAACAGVARQVENLKNGKQPMYGVNQRMDWQVHVEGALGEMALAKHLGLYWSGKGQLTDPDVGAVDVRTTAHESGRLILHDADEDDRRYYLLTGYNGCYNVRGWIMGRDGKVSDYLDDPIGGRQAYFIPQSSLSQ
jgi:hypothetical protein